MLYGFGLTVIALSEGGGSLIDVTPGLIFWTVITFLILLIILRKTAWKPILEALSQREAAIKDSLEKAERAQQEAQKVLDENQANLAKAEEESRKIIDQSRAYAEKLKDQIIQESKQQAQKIISDASAEIERKKDSAFDELKSQIAEISIKAAEKILKQKVDQNTNNNIVNEYINEITKN